MINVLTDIMSPAPDTKRSCIIIKRHSVGRYVVQDLAGKQFIVDSGTSWKSGEWVRVIGTNIDGTSVGYTPKVVNV